jgi:hypothetical protein
MSFEEWEWLWRRLPSIDGQRPIDMKVWGFGNGVKLMRISLDAGFTMDNVFIAYRTETFIRILFPTGTNEEELVSIARKRWKGRNYEQTKFNKTLADSVQPSAISVPAGSEAH